MGILNPTLKFAAHFRLAVRPGALCGMVRTPCLLDVGHIGPDRDRKLCDRDHRKVRQGNILCECPLLMNLSDCHCVGLDVTARLSVIAVGSGQPGLRIGLGSSVAFQVTSLRPRVGAASVAEPATGQDDVQPQGLSPAWARRILAASDSDPHRDLKGPGPEKCFQCY